MLRLIQLITVAMLGTTAVAQNPCRVQGLNSPADRDGIRLQTGTITCGPQSGNVVVFEPISARPQSPPVLFAYSEVALATGRTDLHPMALQLARGGGTVLLLERPVTLEAVDDPGTRAPRLLDCASIWLLSQKNLDLLHITDVGPRVQYDHEKLRTPLAIANLKLPKRGGLRVPLAETTTGTDTLGFTEAETRERLVTTIEQHWHVQIPENEKPGAGAGGPRVLFAR